MRLYIECLCIILSIYSLLANAASVSPLKYNKKIISIIQNGKKIIDEMNIQESLFVLRALDITLNSKSKKILYNALNFILMIVLSDLLIRQESKPYIQPCQILKNNLDPQNSFLVKIMQDNSFYFFILQAYINIIISTHKKYGKKKRISFFPNQYYNPMQIMILKKLFFYITGYHTNLVVIMYYIADQLNTIYKENQDDGISLLIETTVRYCKGASQYTTHHPIDYIFSAYSDDYNNY